MELKLALFSGADKSVLKAASDDKLASQLFCVQPFVCSLICSLFLGQYFIVCKSNNIFSFARLSRLASYKLNISTQLRATPIESGQRHIIIIIYNHAPSQLVRLIRIIILEQADGRQTN